MRVNQHNLPLYIGLGLSAAFLFVAIFGPALAPHNPIAVGRATFQDGETYLPPFRPGEVRGYPLGTDEIGRDMLSRILWAVRPTLLVCLVVVGVRMLVGIPLGLIGGWYGGAVERIIDAAISLSVSIPALVFGVAVISFFSGLQKGLGVFVAALCITGWAETAAFIKNRTRALAQEPYVEAAQAVGVAPQGILRRYVLAQLWTILPVLISFELSAVTLLVAELGFLGLFIGGGFTYGVPMGHSAGSWSVTTSGFPELGQLLSDVWSKIIRVPWAALEVATVVFLEIFAFNVLGEGLRRQMDVTQPGRVWWRRLLRKWQRLPAPAGAATP
jgi:peptide/nickel transport system permease protein